MSLQRLWMAIAILLPPLVSLLVALPAVDLAYQVRTGEMILATGAIPRTDSFTFTVYGQPWLDQQWLSQVLLALGFRLGGWELLMVLRAALAVVMGVMLLLAARLRGCSPRTAAIVALIAFLVTAPALALRPQMFAIALFTVMVALVAGRERHPRAYLLAPVLVIVWANLHGSFVLAPLLLGYAWLEDVARRRPARRAFAVLAASTLATLVNPFGLAVWTYAAGIGASPTIAARVSEWQHTSPLSSEGALFYPSVIAVGILAWRRRSRLVWPDPLWLAGLAFLGAWAVRGDAWWPAGALLVAAKALASTGEATAPRPVPETAARLNALVVGILGLAIVAALPWWRPADSLTGRVGLITYAPTGLTRALLEHAKPGDRVVVPQPWGSWFEWAAPEQFYFVDSRFELFPASIWDDSDRIAWGGDGARDVLDHWQVDAVVLAPDWPMPSGPWTVVYKDAEGQLIIPAPVR
ncbi:MAG: hypothetical protein U0838_04875 [Chloroflexota bacterium]